MKFDKLLQTLAGAALALTVTGSVGYAATIHETYGPSDAVYDAALPTDFTIDAAGVNAIYAQANVQVRFKAAQTIVNAGLTNIDSAAKFAQITSLNNFGNEISMYFVDNLSWCGNINPGYVGCAQLPGNQQVNEASFIANNLGFQAELLAHEIGHNLGLFHTPNANAPSPNLMDPILNGNTTLTAAQVAILLGSSLIQQDANGMFIEVNPFFVTDQTPPPPNDVPIPGAGVLLAGGLSLLVIGRRRKSKA